MQLRITGLACSGLVLLLLSACGSDSSGGGGGNNPPPPVNLRPTANAGTNQSAASGATVTLNGTASADSDGSIPATGFAWTQTAGAPAITLTNATSSQPTFTAPTVVTQTIFTFSLVVTDNQNAQSNNAASVNITVDPPAPGSTNVTGHVTFARVAETNNSGLDYASVAQQPARAVVVRVVNASTQAVLATGSTDANGDYSIPVTNNLNINIVVVAQMLRDNSVPLPRWDFHVMDVDGGTPPYSYNDGVTFNSSAGTAHDIAIPAGFNAAGGVTGTRASAPFAVLDTVYKAVQLILSAAPTADFPVLVLDWAPSNPGGETFFDGGSGTIVLSADVTEDTDEFDQHVIAHEFGHYIEHNFSRADNIGGAHGLGDRLDARVAFGEGFGNAFSAMVLNDSVWRDSFVNGAMRVTFTFNMETAPPVAAADRNGCWCSETSVSGLLWDLYDGAADANDSVALGFPPLWTVLTSTQKTTPAFTTLFSFVSNLKATQAAGVNANINTLVAAQNVDASSIDAFASTETHSPAEVAQLAALPLYTTAIVNGGPVILRNVNDAGTGNTLGNHRYIRFSANVNQVITVTASSSNPDPQMDTDFIVFRAGTNLIAADGESGPAAQESKQFTALANDYLIDVYDCADGCVGPVQGTPGDYNLTVTVTSP